MEGQAQTTENNNPENIANDVEITSTVESTVEGITTDEQQEEDRPIMMSALDDLGLTEEFRDYYNFDDDLDIDTPDGIKEVLKSTLIAGGELFFNQKIKANPELYSVYLHLENGGDIGSFRNDEISLPSLEDVEKNVDLQIKEYRDFLLKAGNDKDDVEALINNAVKNETIKAKAISSLTKRIQDRDTKNTQVATQIKEEEDNKAKIVDNAIGVISNLIRENEFSANIRLNSDSRKQDFFNSLRENLIYEDGAIYYSVPLSDENLKDVMEQHYLLVNKEAKAKFYGNKDKVKNIEGLSLKTKNQIKSVEVVKEQPKEDKISASHFIERAFKNN